MHGGGSPTALLNVILLSLVNRTCSSVPVPEPPLLLLLAPHSCAASLPATPSSRFSSAALAMRVTTAASPDMVGPVSVGVTAAPIPACHGVMTQAML
jgi:hypothetical protein